MFGGGGDPVVVTTPDIGVNLNQYVAAFGTEVGSVVAAVFGLFVVVGVVWASMRWMKRVRSA